MVGGEPPGALWLLQGPEQASAGVWASPAAGKHHQVSMRGGGEGFKGGGGRGVLVWGGGMHIEQASSGVPASPAAGQHH
jgi:hypothetical protein